MPKFNVGDVVVPVKIKFHLNAETHRNYAYTDRMRKLMGDGRQMEVHYCSEGKVFAGNFCWHPDDLELYRSVLENK